ncbi:MAG: nitrogenase-stabilizing/protective protein NifW [Rhodospirillaceae bacterium]
MSDVLDTLQSLSSAEDFLEYLEIDHDPAVVRVNRLHILKRLQVYLAQAELADDAEDTVILETYKECLTKAYQDFVSSDAVTEKVFKVFHDAKGQGFVGLEEIGRL